MTRVRSRMIDDDLNICLQRLRKLELLLIVINIPLSIFALQLEKRIIYYLRNSKKGHNSRTQLPGLTKMISCTSTHHNIHVWQFSFR